MAQVSRLPTLASSITVVSSNLAIVLAAQCRPFGKIIIGRRLDHGKVCAGRGIVLAWRSCGNFQSQCFQLRVSGDMITGGVNGIILGSVGCLTVISERQVYGAGEFAAEWDLL